MSLTSAEATELRSESGALKARDIVRANGDCRVMYAISLHSDAVVALKEALDLLSMSYPSDCPIPLRIDRIAEEGTIVSAGKPLAYVSGSLAALVSLETQILQRIGLACAAAQNAFAMSTAMPRTSFVATDAPYCVGDDMHCLASYGASVGSRSARLLGAKGFIGSSTALGARNFGNKVGVWTMPHALVGYARARARILARGGDPYDECSAVEAAKLYAEAFPDEETLTVLVDYDGREISDALAVARWFNGSGTQMSSKILAFRLETHPSRYLEGLDWRESVRTLMRWTHRDSASEVLTAAMAGIGIEVLDGVSVESVRNRLLFGSGVTAAAVVRFRQALDEAGYRDARIVVSGEFDVLACRVFANLGIPIDVIGTSGILPDRRFKAVAHMDILRYEFADEKGGEGEIYTMTRAGREELIPDD